MKSSSRSEPQSMIPWQDEEVRKGWLNCLEYLRDDEIMTYRDWINVAKDTAFEVLLEEGLDYMSTYIRWVRQLNAELRYLNVISL